MDVNTLPSEYKSVDLKSGIKRYEEDFSVKVIPYDRSRENIQGSSPAIPVIVRIE